MFVVYEFWTGDAAILLVTKSHKKARERFLQVADGYKDDGLEVTVSEEKEPMRAPFEGTLWEAETGDITLRLDHKTTW